MVPPTTLVPTAIRETIAKMALAGARPQAIWSHICSESLEFPAVMQIEGVSQANVYYWWRQSFESQFIRNLKDEVRSAEVWLREQHIEVMFSVDGGEFCPGSLAFLTPLAADPCVQTTGITDVFVDATYKTNKARYDLYCLLADVRGASTPISYLLLRVAEGILETEAPITIMMAEDDGPACLHEIPYSKVCMLARPTHWVEMWFRGLAKRGLRPSWFHSDKDFGQIHPAQQVWPQAKISLCLWHSKKAISTWMKAMTGQSRRQRDIADDLSQATPSTIIYQSSILSTVAATHLSVIAQEATVPLLQIESQTSNPASSAVSTQFLGPDLNLPSGDEPFSEQMLVGLPLHLSFLNLPFNRTTTHRGSRRLGTQHGNEMYDNDRIKSTGLMFSRHYNRHESIPYLQPGVPDEQAPIYQTSRDIHATCVSEMLEVARGRPRFFQYMWQNWYRPGRWELWARSGSTRISMFRTTMKLEAHWRQLKRDFMVEFNRPRMDLLVYIIIKELMVPITVRLHSIAGGAPPPWLDAFRLEWRRAQRRLIDPEAPFNPRSLQKYATDHVSWICACPAFYISTHWVCKHLVYQCDLPQWQYPWWNLTQAPLRFTCSPFVRLSEFREQQADTDTNDMIEDTGIDQVVAHIPDATSLHEDILTADRVLRLEARHLLEAHRTDLNLLEADVATQTGRQLRTVVDALKGLQQSNVYKYAESVRHLERRRRSPRTWADHNRFTLHRT